MKSKQNDASLLAEAYDTINSTRSIKECDECLSCGNDTQSAPSMIAIDIPEPAESNYPDDSEVNMALAELYKIEKYAYSLSQLLQDMPALEGWTASKITKAADYLGSVFHKLDYDVNGHSMHNTGCEDVIEDGE